MRFCAYFRSLIQLAMKSNRARPVCTQKDWFLAYFGKIYKRITNFVNKKEHTLLVSTLQLKLFNKVALRRYMKGNTEKGIKS